ncbi:hypothetical protein SNEBB_004259 [Seison nebaliae]|nr:hypothetical protein SNEBB_004259 [Seison nebaliae]
MNNEKLEDLILVNKKKKKSESKTSHYPRLLINLRRFAAKWRKKPLEVMEREEIMEENRPTYTDVSTLQKRLLYDPHHTKKREIYLKNLKVADEMMNMLNLANSSVSFLENSLFHRTSKKRLIPNLLTMDKLGKIYLESFAQQINIKQLRCSSSKQLYIKALPFRDFLKSAQQINMTNGKKLMDNVSEKGDKKVKKNIRRIKKSMPKDIYKNRPWNIAEKKRQEKERKEKEEIAKLEAEKKAEDERILKESNFDEDLEDEEVDETDEADNFQITTMRIENGLALYYDNLPNMSSKIVRIFTSSTFTDTAMERNSLMENIYPKIKDYCREKYGLQFQVVDMRWGVRDEATDDHMTAQLCMQEIDNCQRLSVGPNFIVFLGQKYGYRPLPAKILHSEFLKLTSVLMDSMEDKALLEKWYRPDDNSVPCMAVLQTISSIFKNFTNRLFPKLMQEDQNKWWTTMAKMMVIVRRASRNLLETGVFTHEDNHWYNWSVTEQEVVRGLLKANDNINHTVAYIRIIENINVELFRHSGKFIDLDPRRQIDAESQMLLSDLRDVRVPAALSAANIIHYKIPWSDNEGLNRTDHAEYLQSFLTSFYSRVLNLIDKGVVEQRKLEGDKLYNEILQHHHVCANICKEFQGREDLLALVRNYIEDDKFHRPLVLWGPSGCGKTSLLAKSASLVFKNFETNILQTMKFEERNKYNAVDNEKSWYDSNMNKSPILIVRFLGSSPESSTVLALLTNICQHISRVYNLELGTLPEELAPMTNYFKNLLEDVGFGRQRKFQVGDQSNNGDNGLNDENTISMTSVSTNTTKYVRPLYIFLDAIDALSNTDGAHSCTWLPLNLPPNVKIVISTLSDHSSILDNLKSLIEEQIYFLEVRQLGPDLGTKILNAWLKIKNRTITREQWNIVVNALSGCNLPLYMKLVFDEIIRWKSYSLPKVTILGSSIEQCISKLLDRVEMQHGKVLVSYALAYVTASKDGLSESEIEDLISLDETVLNDIYQYHLPPIRRIPPLLWTRIRSEMPNYLVERESGGTSVVEWYHRQFADESNRRYLSDASFRSYIHKQMSEYFSGMWAGKAKPFKYSDSQMKMFHLAEVDGEANRKVPSQPNFFLDKERMNVLRYNIRRMNELPYHYIRSQQPDVLCEDILFNYEFVHSKLSALPMSMLIENYIDFYEFYPAYKEVKLMSDALRLSAGVLSSNPDNLGIQICGRLAPFYYTYNNIQKFMDQCNSQGLFKCCMIPTYACFHSPGGPLKFSLEGHQFAIYGFAFIKNGTEIISASNRFMVHDLLSGEISRVISLSSGQTISGINDVQRERIKKQESEYLTEIEKQEIIKRKRLSAIMQSLSISPNERWACSYTNYNDLVVCSLRTSDVKITDEITTKPANFKEMNLGIRSNKLICGINAGDTCFVAWSWKCWWLHDIHTLKQIATGNASQQIISMNVINRREMKWAKLKEQEKKILVEQRKRNRHSRKNRRSSIMPEDNAMDSIDQLIEEVYSGIELEIVIRAEELTSEEEREVEQDDMFLYYIDPLRDIDSFEIRKNNGIHKSQYPRHLLTGGILDCHSGIAMNKDRSRVYTCIDIAGNYVETYTNELTVWHKSYQGIPIQIPVTEEGKMKYHHHEFDDSPLSENLSREWKFDTSFEHNTNLIFGLLLSPNEEQLLAMVTFGYKVFNVRTGKATLLHLPENVRNIPIGAKSLNIPATFAYENQFVIGSVRTDIYCWETINGNLLQKMDAHFARITCLAARSGKKFDVISGSMDKTIKVWNLENVAEEYRSVERLEKPVEAIDIASDANIAVALSRNQLSLFDTFTGKRMCDLASSLHGVMIHKAAITTSGEYLVCAESNNIAFWKIILMEPKEAYPILIQPLKYVLQILWNNSETEVIIFAKMIANRAIAINFRLSDGELLWKFEFVLPEPPPMPGGMLPTNQLALSNHYMHTYRAAVITRDGENVIVLENDPIIVPQVDDDASVNNSKEKKTIIEERSGVRFGIYSTKTGKSIDRYPLNFPGFNKFFTEIVALPHTSAFLGLIELEKGNIVNFKDKRFIRTVQKWNGAITTNGKYGLFAPARGGLEIIDMKNGQTVKQLIGKKAEGVFSVKANFTKTDQHVVYYHSGHRTLRIFRTKDGRFIGNFTCPSKLIEWKSTVNGYNLLLGLEDGSVLMMTIADPLAGDSPYNHQPKLVTKTFKSRFNQDTDFFAELSAMRENSDSITPPKPIKYGTSEDITDDNNYVSYLQSRRNQSLALINDKTNQHTINVFLKEKDYRENKARKDNRKLSRMNTNASQIIRGLPPLLTITNAFERNLRKKQLEDANNKENVEDIEDPDKLALPPH